MLLRLLLLVSPLAPHPLTTHERDAALLDSATDYLSAACRILLYSLWLVRAMSCPLWCVCWLCVASYSQIRCTSRIAGCAAAAGEDDYDRCCICISLIWCPPSPRGLRLLCYASRRRSLLMMVLVCSSSPGRPPPPPPLPVLCAPVPASSPPAPSPCVVCCRSELLTLIDAARAAAFPYSSNLISSTSISAAIVLRA